MDLLGLILISKSSFSFFIMNSLIVMPKFDDARVYYHQSVQEITVKQQHGNQWNEGIGIYSCQERVRISHEQRIPSELLNTS